MLDKSGFGRSTGPIQKANHFSSESPNSHSILPFFSSPNSLSPPIILLPNRVCKTLTLIFRLIPPIPQIRAPFQCSYHEAMATLVSSAGGLLAMLNESHPLLKLHALSNLNNLVDNFWPEISTSVPVMYEIALSLFFGLFSLCSWMKFCLLICGFLGLCSWVVLFLVFRVGGDLN